MQNVRKIAVLRANAMGDFIFTLPAIHALRIAYPEAEIVFLGKQWHAEFIPGHVRDVDRIVVIPACPGVGEPEDSVVDTGRLDVFFAAMEAEKFDLAFQMHGGGRYSNPFIARLHARRTIGSQAANATSLDISVPYVFYQNEVLRYLELAALAGATTDAITPSVAVIESDARTAQKLMGSDPYAVVHPGASDPRRRWPTEKFSAVANHCLDRGLRVVVTGASDEIELADRVVAGTKGRAVNTCGMLSLADLTGVLAAAKVMIANDTGPLHLARAVDCVTVGIYWCGNYITAGPIRHEWHQSLLSWTLDCPACGVRCTNSLPFDAGGCDHAVSFVDEVRADDVLAAVDLLLSRTNQRNPAGGEV